MIDIHAHILPELDDGADNIAESVLMADTASDNDVDIIVATPHADITMRLDGDTVKKRVGELNGALKNDGINIKILPGMEILTVSDIVPKLKSGELLTLNGSRYVLVEFVFDEDAYEASDILERITDGGYVPILAHPERYHCVQRRPGIVFDWVMRGAFMQVNKGSILGRFGNSVRSTAMRLLDCGLVSAVASDAHGIFTRTTAMSEVQDAISEIWDYEYAELLLEKNPEKIINDMDIKLRNPIPVY